MAYSSSPTLTTGSCSNLTNNTTGSAPTTAPLTVYSSEQHSIRRKRSSFNDIFKLLVLGDDFVGKSALIVRYLTKKFIGEYENNLDIKYRHSEIIENNQVLIEICDSINNKNISSNQFEENVKWAEGFIFVYDITRQSSFDYVVELKLKVTDIKKLQQISMILVGNKNDLEHRRSVNRFEIEKFINESCCMHVELSVANSYEDTKAMFTMLCRDIIINKRRSRTFLNRVLGGIGATSHKK